MREYTIYTLNDVFQLRNTRVSTYINTYINDIMFMHLVFIRKYIPPLLSAYIYMWTLPVISIRMAKILTALRMKEERQLPLPLSRRRRYQPIHYTCIKICLHHVVDIIISYIFTHYE